MAVEAGEGLSPAQLRTVESFLKGGCVRVPNGGRRGEGHRVYKKGWEARFYVGSEVAVGKLRRVLARAGLEAGREYVKGPGRWILPVYGREQVARLLGWIETVGR